MEHGAGPARVLAGAGTGKTTVVVRRFHHLVAQGVRPERILVLTFSREAARSLRDAILPGLVAGTRLWVSTFHSFCLRLLESEAPGGLRLVQEPEALLLLQAIAAAAGPWQWYVGPLAARLPAEALTLSNQAKDYLLTPAHVAAYAAAGADCRLADLARAYAALQAALEREGAATFSDFIARAVALLEGDAAVAARWQGCFDHILVDEFQDTNPAQFRVLRVLAAGHGNLAVVGDDDQAIYRFRGATDRFILRFAEHFPAAATYPVEENFRCPAPVLAVANALIAHNPGRVPKTLFTRSKRQGYPPVQHWEARSGPEEGEAVAADIARRVAAGTPPEAIAVLCRSVRRGAGDLLQALSRRNLPHRVIGDEREHPVVAQTLALLRLTQTLTAADILSVLAGRLAPADLYAALRAAAGDLPALLTSGDAPLAFAAAAAELQAWLAAHAALPPGPLTYAALRWLGHLRLSLHLSAADADRLAAARSLQERAAAAPTLVALLASGAAPGDWQPGPGVTVLTVHAAKGLQWPLVYVIGLAEGRFPVAVTSAPVFYTAEAIRDWVDAAGLADPSEAAGAYLREERRLAYVALTRAATELILTRARQYGQEVLPPSRFLAELGAPPPLDVSAARADPLPLARDYLLQVAAGAEAPTPDRVAQAVKLLREAPEAVPLRRQTEPAPFGGDESLSLSATALELYRDCPRKYYYAQVMGLPDTDNVHLAFGEAVHAALQAYNLARQGGAAPAAAELEGWFAAAFARERCETEGQHAQLLARGETFLRRYHAWASARPEAVLAAETPFAAPYVDRHGRTHTVRGRIDLILRGPQGVEIVDYKTGHRKSSANTVNKRPTGKSENDPQRKLQPGLYYLAHFAGRVEPGARVTYVFLRHPEDRPPGAWVEGFDANGEQVITCEHTADTLQGIRDRVDAVIDGILANRFERAPEENKCRWCPFRQPCEASPAGWF